MTVAHLARKRIWSGRQYGSFVIVIGTGRCGSTLVFETYPCMKSWFGLLTTDKSSRPEIASIAPRIYVLSRLAGFPEVKSWNRGEALPGCAVIFPKPLECYRLRETMCGIKFRRDFLVGVKADKTNEAKYITR